MSLLKIDNKNPIIFCGVKHWYEGGVVHREEGPAIEFNDGYKEWYKNGKIHREDGPAIEYSSGTNKWLKNGKLHREDGPAIEYSDGRKEWYFNDKCYGRSRDYTNESWSKFIKTLIFS